MDLQENKLTLKNFLSDGGLKSRKLWMSVLALVLITAMVCVGCHYGAVTGMFPEYVGGVLGVLTIFTGGNVVARNATTKHLADKLGPVFEPAQKSPEPRPPVEQLPGK